jgi:hypothetical protein
MTVLPASASVHKGAELASRLPEWSPSAHDRWILQDTDQVERYQMQKHKTEPAGFEPARLATTDSEQKVSYSSLSD